jgi:propanediol utilization protein
VSLGAHVDGIGLGVKTGVNMAGKIDCTVGLYSCPVVASVLKISNTLFDCRHVELHWDVIEASQCKGNVRAGFVGKAKQHAYNQRVTPSCWLAVPI